MASRGPFQQVIAIEYARVTVQCRTTIGRGDVAVLRCGHRVTLPDNRGPVREVNRWRCGECRRQARQTG